MRLVSLLTAVLMASRLLAQDADEVPADFAALQGKLVSVTPAEARMGDTVTTKIEVAIPKGWHIYSIRKGTAGIPTSFSVTAGPVRVAEGVKEPEPKLHRETYENGTVEEYLFHEGTATFEVPLVLTEAATPGAAAFKVSVKHMLCTMSVCLEEREIEFEGKVTVLEGGTAPPPVEPKKPGPGAGPAPPAGPPADASFLGMLGLAFLGGLLLNIMPCVLPVLTLKLFSIVEQKHVTPGARRAAALAYGTGVLLCLNAFALAVVVLRSLGSQVGWGFQFQSPGFVIGLTTVIFVFALSLLGVFEVPQMGAGVASQAGRKQGWVGHLMTGLFVTVIATPCSAPFLGTGLGFALTLPGWGVFLFMSAAGLGLALPFLVIGFVPALFRFLPKPGPWIEPFQKIMGFGLVATAVWLMDTIATLTGTSGVIGYLAFLTAVSFGAWMYGKWGTEVSTPRARWLSITAALAISIGAGKLFLVTKIVEAGTAAAAFRTEGLQYQPHLPWQPFSEENVAAIRAARKPGFIDFTADW